jgi:RNA polymerase sigma factor (sigma-70 family)
MASEPYDPHLSRITTEWDIVFQAHKGLPAEVTAAQTELMMRYSGAVHRYLLAGTRDPDAAAELDQEFALRFLRGDFHRADPARGRFRDFVKRSLRNLMIDYQRRRRRQPHNAGDDLPDRAGPEADLDESFDRDFLLSWRKELMTRAWEALADLQRRTGQPFHAVLRARVEYPEMRSPQLAEHLTRKLGKAVNDAWVRQTLLRARDKFANLLLDEVSASIESPTYERIEAELIELDVLEYCRPVLKKRMGGAG